MALVIQNISSYTQMDDHNKYHSPLIILTMGIGGCILPYSIVTTLVIWAFAAWMLVKSNRIDKVYLADRNSNFESHLNNLPTQLLILASKSPELNFETKREITKYLNKNRKGWSMECHPH